MDKRKIIFDVDTGSDDAVMLILGLLSPEFDVVGISTVNGNREVKLTTDNTLRVIDMLGSKVPVYKGCEYPMVATLTPHRKPGVPRREGSFSGTRSLIHGDHLPLPEPTTKEQDLNAVSWLIDVLMKSDGDITLVPVGPFTNIAMAMRAEPRIIPKIKEIMLMGGGYLVNNISSMAEYNVWIDPESLEIVLQSGCKITMVPLDATHQAYLTLEEAKEMRTYGTPAADAVASFIEQRTKGYATDLDMLEAGGAPIHDALCVAALLDPSVLVDVRHVNCHVDISGGVADGMTCLDMRLRNDLPEGPNCYFAMGADRDKFSKIVRDILKRNQLQK